MVVEKYMNLLNARNMCGSRNAAGNGARDDHRDLCSTCLTKMFVKINASIMN